MAICCLCDIKPGEYAVVKKLNNETNMRRRLQDIGLIEETKVKCLGRSACGDPSAYLIRGAVIAIRSDDSKKVIVDSVSGD